MWNKVQKVLLVFLTVSTIILMWMVWELKSSQPRFGYVMIDQAFNEFQMKKELQQEFENEAMKRISVLDSMELKLKLISSEISSIQNPPQEKVEEFNNLRSSYFSMKDEINSINQSRSEEFDTQIFKQLNQYVNDFGKQNGYTYLFGATGNGSIMYADEIENVTGKVIGYINERYNGKN